jgi:hypothetical protein
MCDEVDVGMPQDLPEDDEISNLIQISSFRHQRRSKCAE